MKGSTTDGFFEEQKEKSRIKSYIVSEFFKTYYSILFNAKMTKNGFNYIDLFSGPGVYKDGSKSTPALLLDFINTSVSDIASQITMIFNDENPDFCQTLKGVVENHPAYCRMRNKPIIYNDSASNVNIQQYLIQGHPTFSFIDPWGYKDISATQVKDLVKSIGSDCILFFNVNRILQDLSKPTSESHMTNIFGSEYDNACALVNKSDLNQQQKSRKFVKLFSKNLYNREFAFLKKRGYRLYVLPFAFMQDEMDKTSHYILFVSKNHKAISEMKRIMVKQSNSNSEELFYDNKTANMLFSLFSRKDNISQEIEKIILKMLQDAPSLIFQECSIIKWFELMDRYSMKTNYIVTPYVFNEFKEAVSKMDDKGLIEVTSTIKRKRITKNAVIKFKNIALEK